MKRMVLVALLAAGGVAGLFTAGEQARGARAAVALGAILLVGIWPAGYVVSTHLSWRATVERARIDDTLR